MSNVFDEVYQKHNDAIQHVGFGVQGVFATVPDEPSFCYTVGLSKKLGAEIIIVAPTNVQSLHGILYQTTVDCINNGKITVGKFELSEYRMQLKDSMVNLRAEIVELANDSPNANVLNFRVGDVTKVYQLYVADKNNLLPNEEGYDEDNWGYKLDEQ